MLERFASQVAIANSRVALFISMLAAAAAVAGRGSIRPARRRPIRSRIVRIVVPFPAGGTADILPRIVADRLSEQWRQPVIIENCAGAGGNIGAEAVAGSAPDGYVLLASPPGPIAINDNLYKKLAFQPIEVRAGHRAGNGAQRAGGQADVSGQDGARADRPCQSQSGQDHLRFARQRLDLAFERDAVQKLTDTQMLHVPYRGTTPALQDIMGNHVDLFFDNLGSSLPLHSAGNVRILAVGSPSRVPSLPDVPTLQEVGVAGFQSITWFAVMARRGRPLRLRKPSTRPSPQLCGCRRSGSNSSRWASSPSEAPWPRRQNSSPTSARSGAKSSAQQTSRLNEQSSASARTAETCQWRFVSEPAPRARVLSLPSTSQS